MDLVTFLRARLDEREAAAKASEGAWIPLGPDPLDQRPIARLMSMHDPQFVLADVAAKRRLLDLHEPIPSCSAGILQCRHCADLCHSGSGLSCDSPDAPYPCPTVRLVSAPFAQHPDFDPAWAVPGEQS